MYTGTSQRHLSSQKNRGLVRSFALPTTSLNAFRLPPWLLPFHNFFASFSEFPYPRSGGESTYTMGLAMLACERVLLWIAMPAEITELFQHIPQPRKGKRQESSNDADALARFGCVLFLRSLMFLGHVLDDVLRGTVEEMHSLPYGSESIISDTCLETPSTYLMQIANERLAAVATEVLTNNYAQKFQGPSIRCHRVCYADAA